MYNQTFKAITLNYNSFLDRAREARFVKGLDVRVDLLVLRTYIHELIHAASKQIDVVSLDNVPADSKEVSMCGFAILSYSGEGESETEESFFVDFDEAVTEKLANEVFLEYCKRTQDFSDDELANFDKIDSIHTDSRIKMLEEMIEQVSVESGATKDDVWQKVKQGKLAGVKTVLDWIKELEQIFGENYLELLAKDSNEMRQHVENLKDKRRKAEFEKED